MDICNIRPGIIKTKVKSIDNPAAKFAIQSALDTELNRMLSHRMTSTVRALSGRALITGRAFLYRRSRYDWQFRSSRLLCSLDEGDDIYSSEFREWAFRGRLTLRDIDARIETTENTKDQDGTRADSGHSKSIS
jgi:hypothetical protein